MISYGDMIDAVDAEEKKNVPTTAVQTAPQKKAEPVKKEEKEEVIEEVIEEKEDLDNEN